MNFIHLENVKKKFPDGTLGLQGVTLSIEKGAFVAIKGPSGSGKSTLLNILGFLDRHTEGSYVFDGKNALDYSEDELAHIRNAKMGFIFQSFNLLARVSVFDNVMLPLVYSTVPRSEWKKKTKLAIESVNLTHRQAHDVTKISGGEKQRVAIARALVNDPNIIFADEPTGNLDSQSGQNVMEAIQVLHEQQGRTICLITHETYAAEYADRIISIKDGVVTGTDRVTTKHKKGDRYIK